MRRRGARDRLCRASPLALAGLLLSCDPNPSPPPPAAPTLEAEHSGCSAFYDLPEPVCALWPGPDPKLKLWVKADAGSRVEIRTDGQLLTTAGEPVRGGLRYLLPIPKQSSQLTVSALPPDGGRARSWSLRLAEPDMPAWTTEIRELASRGERDEARGRLQQLRQTAPRNEQGLVLRSLAYLARAKGNDQQEALYLRQGVSVERAGKRWSGEVDQATQLARLYRSQGRFSEARQVLDALRLPARAPADAKYLVAYYHGLLSESVGDYRSALEQLRKADDLAARVGMDKHRWDAGQVLARVLQDLGRSQEAAKLFASLRSDPHPANPCDLGLLLTNWGWSRLLAREAGEHAEDPTPILEEAEGELEAHRCPPELRLNARLNLALAHQQRGGWTEARRALRETRALAAATPNLRQRLWWNDLEARAAIAEGRPERALKLYEQLAGMAGLALSPEGRLRALLGQARARLALGQRTAAIAALAAADHLIDEQSWRIPAHEGRDTFIAQREAVTRLYLELPVERRPPGKRLRPGAPRAVAAAAPAHGYGPADAVDAAGAAAMGGSPLGVLDFARQRRAAGCRRMAACR